MSHIDSEVALRGGKALDEEGVCMPLPRPQTLQGGVAGGAGGGVSPAARPLLQGKLGWEVE